MNKTLAAVLAVLSSAATGQEAPTPADPPPAVVEVKANADTLRKNDTASRVVVTHEELVKYGDRSALDAMKRLPGVTVSDGGVRMRGLGGGYTQLLVDGERAPAGFSLEALAPEAIEKIEVVRAATAEYSTQSIAGTINIILRKTVNKDSGELKLGYGGGAGSRSPGITVGRSGKRGDLSHTLGASVARSERPSWLVDRESSTLPDGRLDELRETRTQYRQLFTSINANARLGWTPRAGDSLTWQAFFNRGSFDGSEDNRTTTLAGPAYPYPYLPAALAGDATSLRSDVALARRLEGGARLEAKLALSASHNTRNIARQAYRADRLVLDAFDAGDIHDKGVTSTGKYLVPLIEGHAFAFGWDVGRSRYEQRDLRTERALAGNLPINFDNGFDATIDRVAAYAQDEWDLRPGWSVYLGARWEGMRMHTTGDGFAPTRARYQVFSPLAQTLWKIPGAQQDQLRLALSRTYRAPPISRLIPNYFYTTFNSEVSPDYMGNPRLRPELATGIDAAYEHYFTAGGLVSVSASTRAIRDFIRSTVRFDGLRWVSAPVNQGRARVDSLAFEAKLPMKTLGSTLPVELRANVSRNWSRVDAVPGPGNRLDRQPRWSANLGADYGGPTIAAGASFSFVSGGWTRTSIFQSAYGGSTRDLDAFALYKFSPLRQLRFTASNLLAPSRLGASRYADERGVQQSATVGSSYRTWRLQYEHQFQVK
ncbi:TonB-dependent receptor plug domain-containing protein [Massilia yuzhufengensis]|uniref:Outer membrane receptor for ferrienterochelin and colicins n=1 Tax=Massilia yuzhufengensis TaxID=1164594 RepID=A0A1I1W017_9BURK|nr:TonB-dependent receptor [Massilia yuzhufengensis]SFD88547.1 Outer membrane receptor for ferrienterochelin and colicins [Massilia yuzhufengensis]